MFCGPPAPIFLEEEETVDFMVAAFLAFIPLVLEDLDILKGKCFCLTSSESEMKIMNIVRDGSFVHNRGDYLSIKFRNR